MRTCKRNERPFSYCLYKTQINDTVDEWGNLTGEPLIIYEEPVQMSGNISAATGQAQTEQFGNLDSYDRVIVTADMTCPIDEHTVLFIDKEPEFGEDIIIGYEETTALLEEPTPIIYKPPLYDYIVKRVAKSLNSISIAVRKVDVG